MADIISHITIDGSSYCFFDSVTKDENNYTFKGWIGSFKGAITSLSYGDSYPSSRKLDVKFSQRHDVLDTYKFPSAKNGMYGIEFKIAISEFTPRAILFFSIADSERLEMVSTLDKWVVYYSGFSENSEDKGLISVDNFYEDPDAIREFAINKVNFAESKYHKGQRAQSKFILDGTKEKLQKIIGKEIYNWNHDGYANGIFQFCTADQALVYHIDTQTYAGIVYLTPDAPPSAGTSFYKSKANGRRSFPGNDRSSQDYIDTFTLNSDNPNFYDSTQFELVDTVGNVYNRLVLFDASQIHAAAEYFGDTIKNSRLFHMFFFDVK